MGEGGKNKDMVLSNRNIVKNNSELIDEDSKMYLNQLLQSIVVHIAPLLTCSHVVDFMSLEDAKIKIHILNVSEITNNIIYLETEVNTRSKNNVKMENHNLYLFRLTSPSTLQPFLCISREDDTQIVTAYATENEFIISDLKGNINEILDNLIKQTSKEHKKVLKRYLDLLKNNVVAD